MRKKGRWIAGIAGIAGVDVLVFLSFCCDDVYSRDMTISKEQQTVSQNYHDAKVNAIGGVVTAFLCIGIIAYFGTLISPDAVMLSASPMVVVSLLVLGVVAGPGIYVMRKIRKQSAE